MQFLSALFGKILKSKVSVIQLHYISFLCFNFAAPSQDLVDFVKLTMELEKAAQKIANGTVDFFQVTVDGKGHTITPGDSGLTYSSSVRCPKGSVRLDVFCGEN